MVNLDYPVRKIIADIAQEMDMDPKLVEEAVLTQFKFTAEEMGRGDFNTIMLPRLGKFAVNQKRLANVNKHMHAAPKKDLLHGTTTRRRRSDSDRTGRKADKGI